ncbi:hypothetical protein [Mycoplasmopsis arginini]|uniref:hypothetical protein n=1 Tax=Mycoplasmopsis arginini TaxID=2094 RepID=UPI00249E06D6|nr:hypothetical protein [Mycoplasmopsis arginini]MDI3350470.1 hypothetical protein [Mycoplasmopsis arginini]MDI3350818.1 hypothetical protein [Mycoplasmopsis arginini]
MKKKLSVGKLTAAILIPTATVLVSGITVPIVLAKIKNDPRKIAPIIHKKLDKMLEEFPKRWTINDIVYSSGWFKDYDVKTVRQNVIKHLQTDEKIIFFPTWARDGGLFGKKLRLLYEDPDEFDLRGEEARLYGFYTSLGLNWLGGYDFLYKINGYDPEKHKKGYRKPTQFEDYFWNLFFRHFTKEEYDFIINQGNWPSQEYDLFLINGYSKTDSLPKIEQTQTEKIILKNVLLHFNFFDGLNSYIKKLYIDIEI